MDLYDYKPKMNDWYDKDLPDSIRKGQRLTTMTCGPGPVSRSRRRSTSSPSTASAACGSASCCPRRPRWSTTCASSAACTPRPSITSRPSPTCRPATRSPAGPAWAPGPRTAWARSTTTCRRSSCWWPSRPITEQVQAISARLWSSGYLSGEHAGVSFRTSGDPILYINNPPGVSAEVRRNTLDGLQGAQRNELPDRGRSRRRTRASSNTSWPSACSPACRS